MEWTTQDDASNTIDVDIPATGDWNFRLYQRDYQFVVDKFVMWLASESYDFNDSTTGRGNSGDDYFGDPESTLGTGTAVTDNPDNPTAPIVPPSAQQLTGEVLLPADNATNIDISQTVTIQYVGTTGINGIITLTGAGDTPIVGTQTIGFDSIAFTPDNPLGTGTDGTLHTARAVGTAFDSGVLKSFDVTWTFTTIADTAPTGIIFSQDFSSISTQTGLTRALCRSLFQTDFAGINGTEDGYSHNAQDIVLSPDNAGARGYVHRCFQPEGGWGGLDPNPPFPGSLGPPGNGQWRPWNDSAASEVYDELYCSVDMYIPPLALDGTAFEQMKQLKTPVSFYAGSLVGSDLAFEGIRVPVDDEGWSIRISIYGPDAGARPWGISMYTWISNRPAYWSSVYNDNVTNGVVDSLLVDPRPGRWWRPTLYIKLNDVGLDNGIARLYCGEAGKQLYVVKTLTGLRFRHTAGHNIKGGFAIHGYGGNDISYAAPQDQYIYYDNYRYSTSKPAGVP